MILTNAEELLLAESYPLTVMVYEAFFFPGTDQIQEYGPEDKVDVHFKDPLT